jgi:hypothetical protein
MDGLSGTASGVGEDGGAVARDADAFEGAGWSQSDESQCTLKA